MEYSGKIPQGFPSSATRTKSKSIKFFFPPTFLKIIQLPIEAAKMMMIPREDLAKSGNKPVNGVKNNLESTFYIHG
jgi:hypothetical protein